jgi:predicted amino acid-binding ACT domain protein
MKLMQSEEEEFGDTQKSLDEKKKKAKLEIRVKMNEYVNKNEKKILKSG